MASKKHSEIIADYEKEFINLFNSHCHSISHWQVWQDIIYAIACGISNAVDKTEEHWKKREQEYIRCAKELGGDEAVAQFLALIVNALDENPAQDFLGRMFMSLDLGNNWKGQFFTPYDVAALMARINIPEADERIEREGYVSIMDPACGAGVTLIAAAQRLTELGVNYQQRAIFIEQDIDRTVALMCYIQLSLLGCPGYIVIGDTLSHPMTGSDLFPQESEGQEVWCTPMFFSEIWHYRRLFRSVDGCMVKNRDHTIYFNFDGEEENGRENIA